MIVHYIENAQKMMNKEMYAMEKKKVGARMKTGYRNIDSKDGTLSPQLKNKEVVQWLKKQARELDAPVGFYTELILQKAYQDYQFYVAYENMK